MGLPVGLQMWSLRDDCREDFFGTVRKVADLGFAGVEFAGFYGHKASEVKRVLEGCGLKAAGSHVGLDQLAEQQILETLEFHRELECPFVIVPWLPEEMRNSPASVSTTVAQFVELAERVSEAGMLTGFHNHEADMKPLEGGKSAWQLIAEGTPENFVLQYDTCNGKMGGVDVVQPILDYPGRAKTVHLKGYPPGTPAGEGNTDWSAVFQACETTGGTEWYIVEHEEYQLGTPFECVQKCAFNLRQLGKM